MILKARCNRILVIGFLIIVLIIDAGLLISVFLTRNFTIVILAALMMTVAGLTTALFVCFPMVENLFSPLSTLVIKMKEYAGGEARDDEVACLDQACSMMSKAMSDFRRSNTYLQKFIDSVYSATTTGDLTKAAQDGLKAIEGDIDGALLLLVNDDRTKAVLYPLFPEGIAGRSEFRLGADGIWLRDLRIKSSYHRRSLSGQLNLNELEKVFAEKGYESSVMIPVTNEEVFFGIVGAAVKENPHALKAAIRPLESIAGLLAVKLAYFKSTINLSKKEGQLIDFKQVEKKKIEQQLKKLKEAYNEVVQASKMASLGQLSAGVAHELNNPIGGILGYVQLILNKLKGASPSRQAIETSVKYLQMVEKESKRCQWIISNLLSFSRKHEEEMAPLSIQDVIDNTVSMLEYQLSQKDIRVSVSFPPEGLKKINGNANQLQQVFTNFIQNAQDAMRQGGTITIVGANKVLTKYRRPLEYIEVSVADTGSGISKENIAKIFDPFYTSKIGRSGTGLGLSITHTIIGAHKGTVRVESEEGKGTNFIVNFPVIKDAKSDQPNDKKGA